MEKGYAEQDIYSCCVSAITLSRDIQEQTHPDVKYFKSFSITLCSIKKDCQIMMTFITGILIFLFLNIKYFF
jgi:hypothetical protein